MSAAFRPSTAEPLMVAWEAGEKPMLAAESLLAWMFPAERLALAARAIRLLEPEAAASLCERYLAEHRGGSPVPTFDDVHREAAAWAADASRSERDAYFAALWAVMPDPGRREFLAAAGAP